MTTIDIQKEAKKIVDTLVAKYRPEKIIAFGSFAKGEIDQDSDLDLCLIKDDVPPSSVERRFVVYALLPNRTVPLDLVVYRPSEFEERRSLGDPFIKTILAEGKILYG